MAGTSPAMTLAKWFNMTGTGSGGVKLDAVYPASGCHENDHGRKLPIPAKKSLFGAAKFPVRYGTGNRPQHIGIAAQMDAGTGGKHRNGPRFPTFPCYLPCSEGIQVLLALVTAALTPPPPLWCGCAPAAPRFRSPMPGC